MRHEGRPSIAKKDLDVQTKMSDTVFLDPVGPDKKTIFVQIRNTSDRSFDIEGAIVSALVARGYRVTQDPDAAHFRLLGNVLSVAKAIWPPKIRRPRTIAR